MAKKEEILRVENLKQHFKSGFGKNKIVVKAVDGVSFTINKGEVFSLVGESGCGKTTTGRTIIQLYKSSGGEVFFHGQRVLSDIKKAKADFKEAVKQAKAARVQKISALKLEKDAYGETQLKEEKDAINVAYAAAIAAARADLKQAKRDRNFEKQIDEEGKHALKHLEDDERYIKIKDKYASRIERLEEEISRSTRSLNSVDPSQKEEKKAIKAQIESSNRELKLNLKRQKQDVDALKHDIVMKNKTLMRKMQMIFQDPIASLNPRMTVREIIAEGLRINGIKNEEEIENRIKEALKTVGLVPEHASRYPHEFSGGQRQRIGIARSLVVEPSFIIADEPISALDVSIRAHVINLLNELREEKGITILFIAHDLSVVKYFSDRLAVMYFGNIVEIGDKNKIFNNPMHPYTLSLLDSIPLPDPKFEQRRTTLKRYNPAEEHDYSTDLPTLREIEKDHFVLCNEAEYKKYKAQLKS